MPPPQSRLQPPTKVNNALRQSGALPKTEDVTGQENKKPVAATTTALPVKKNAPVKKTVAPVLKRKAVSAAPARSPPVKKTVACGKAAPSKPAPASKSAAIGKKRPAWDTKGRLEDMEALTAQLQHQVDHSSKDGALFLQKLEDSQARVTELESFRSSLQSSLEVKLVENTHQQEKIDALERDLSRVKLEFETTLRQKEARHSEQVEDLERASAKLRRELEDTEQSLVSAREQNRVLTGAISEESGNVAKLEAMLKGVRLTLAGRDDTLVEREAQITTLKEQMATAEATIVALEEKLQQEETMRRVLHNTVQELKGNIRVFCRVRPPLGGELEGTSREALMKHLEYGNDAEHRAITLNQVMETATGASVEKAFDFTFDNVFCADASQADVFKEISQLVQSACDGYNVCIFAYGQTGSGKTFTMEGPQNSLDDEAKMGMIPRSVLQIWEHTHRLADKGWLYTMEGSFVEVYNETLRDLLGDGDTRKQHEIKHHPTTNRTTVSDAQTVILDSPAAVIALLKKAAQNRRVAETQCNERSSRSHSVFMLRITGRNEKTGEATEGVLNLIDLAGSERLNSSQSTGDRLKETQAINKSLSALGDVIAALGNKDAAHVPYRNSKLTYLLKNSLGGNCKTLMFVNVSPLAASFGETLSSLRFATKVNNCQIGTARRTVG